MKDVLTNLLLVAALVLIPACASESPKLNQKVANESDVESRRDLQVEADYLIRTSKLLSEVQKDKLLKLRSSTKNQMDDLEHQSLMLRSVLLKSVLSEKFDPKEVDAIKGKLKKVENQKLAQIFDTVEQANKIMGRTRLGSQDAVFTDFFMFDTLRTIH
ncbi:MAG: hypothetical protein ACXWQE_14450 [Bdellovibrionales bacterium]